MSNETISCGCVHPDAIECYARRYTLDGSMSREEALRESRGFGGCMCGCHDQGEDAEIEIEINADGSGVIHFRRPLEGDQLAQMEAICRANRAAGWGG